MVKKMVATAALGAFLLVPAAAAHADDARFGTKPCTGGKGRVIWWYDLDNQYHENDDFCAYVGP